MNHQRCQLMYLAGQSDLRLTALSPLETPFLVLPKGCQPFRLLALSIASSVASLISSHGIHWVSEPGEHLEYDLGSIDYLVE